MQRPLGACTSEHKLADVEQRYIQSIYRFRRAEKSQSRDYRPARCEMNRLEAELFMLRQSVYSNTPYFTRKRNMIDQSFSRCPEPAWD